MPGIEDWINCPLDIIQRLFDEDGQKHTNKIHDYFKKRTENEKGLSWIPSLNDTPLHNLKTNTLVKFRCMVQDMHDPEFYLGVYEVVDKNTGMTFLRSGKYKDLGECQPHQEIKFDSPRNVTMDRMTLYCVPVPGENDWVKQGWRRHNHSKQEPSTSNPVRTKRTLDDDLGAGDASATMETDVGTNGVTQGEGDGADKEEERKRTRTEQQPGEATGRGPPNLNFPLPDEKGPACIVKVYEETESYKLNEVIEFIGVLSNDPAMASFPENDESESAFPEGDGMEGVEEQEAHCPPPSLVPRLHVLTSTKLEHINPHVPHPVAHTETEVQNVLSNVISIRNELLSMLEHILLGDKLAAQYMLCHLISSVYSRRDVVALGKFALNLSNCPPKVDFANHFHKVLQKLVTHSHLISMELENLNKASMVPRKDYSANRLHTGLLQLAPNTHLLLDETVMEAGQLDATGVKNVTALGNMINWQKVEYDFNFHTQDFMTNISTMVLSEGKSLIKCDCHVPLKPQNMESNFEDRFKQIHDTVLASTWDKLQSYLTIVRLLPYELGDTVQKAIEEDFVRSRKDNPKGMSVDDFHSLLCLARLLSLSLGQRSLSLETWKQAKALEQERKQRLPAAAPASTTR